MHGRWTSAFNWIQLRRIVRHIRSGSIHLIISWLSIQIKWYVWIGEITSTQFRNQNYMCAMILVKWNTIFPMKIYYKLKVCLCKLFWLSYTTAWRREAAWILSTTPAWFSHQNSQLHWADRRICLLSLFTWSTLLALQWIKSVQLNCGTEIYANHLCPAMSNSVYYRTNIQPCDGFS